MNVIGDIVLCGTTGYLFTQEVIGEWTYATYSFFLGHGIFGIINYLKPTNTGKSIQEITATVNEYIPLPFVATTLYLHTDYRKEIAYIHAGSAIIPLIIDLVQSDRDNKNLKDLVCIANIASVIFLAITTERYLRLGCLCGMAAVNRFSVPKIADALDVNYGQAMSIGLAGFAIISWWALRE